MLAIEAKGKDIEMGSNCLHMIMASNEDWAVPAAMDDRRFFILEATDKQRNAHEYFEKIQAQLDGGGYAALLDFLLRRNIRDYNPRKRPTTLALSVEKQMSLGPVEAYWYECLRNGTLSLLGSNNDSWPLLVCKAQLYDEVRRRAGNYLRTTNIGLGIMFTRKLLPPMSGKDVRITGKTVWRDHMNNERIAINAPAYQMPPLAVCRLWWERRFGITEPWPELSGDAAKVFVPDNLPF
jgi:hypothetical protein